MAPARIAAVERRAADGRARADPREGLPRRPWFTHQIYAPGFYTGYGVKTLPAVREAIEERDFDEAAAQIPKVAATIEAYAAEIEKAAAALEKSATFFRVPERTPGDVSREHHRVSAGHAAPDDAGSTGTSACRRCA